MEVVVFFVADRGNTRFANRTNQFMVTGPFHCENSNAELALSPSRGSKSELADQQRVSE